VLAGGGAGAGAGTVVGGTVGVGAVATAGAGAAATAEAGAGLVGTAGGGTAGNAGAVAVAGADALDTGWPNTLVGSITSRTAIRYVLSRIAARLPITDSLKHAGRKDLHLPDGLAHAHED
jgi:hypothetical protein